MAFFVRLLRRIWPCEVTARFFYWRFDREFLHSVCVCKFEKKKSFKWVREWHKRWSRWMWSLWRLSSGLTRRFARQMVKRQFEIERKEYVLQVERIMVILLLCEVYIQTNKRNFLIFNPKKDNQKCLLYYSGVMYSE